MPLTTLQGLSPDRLKATIGGRDLFIWGTGDIGLDVLTSLRQAGIPVSGFLHTAPESIARLPHGQPVFGVDQILGARHHGLRPVVVIATAHFRDVAESACRNAGLSKDQDYLTYLAIPRPVAVIEVAGRPSVTPRLMSLEKFKLVLAKIRTDQPLLCHVELAWLGEPTLNPELPQIVSYCEQFVPCTVLTELRIVDNLEAVLVAQPSRFSILAYGFAESYEQYMGEASWSAFQEGLTRLKSLIVQHRGRTRFALRYIRTNGEPLENTERWRDLLAGTDIALSVETPYVTPYDALLGYCEHQSLPKGTEQSFRRLTWNLDAAIDLCTRDRDNPCLSQRVFPVIGVDLAVGLCHLYEKPELAHDYLAANWQDLLKLRHNAAHCERCQRYGLHRLDLPVLLRRYPSLGRTLFDR